MKMGAWFSWGFGAKTVAVGAFAIVIGFGKRPFLPRLHRCRQHIFTRFSLLAQQLLYISVHYHIIDYVHKHKKYLCEVKQKWDGEPEEEQAHGQETAHSATCHHGSDQVGFTAGEHAGTYTAPTVQCPQ